MICPRCASTVEEGACFCGECGNALSPVYSQQPYAAAPCQSYPAPAQPMSQPSVVCTPITCGVNIVYPDGHNEIGDLYITPAEIVFMKKSKAVRIAFGFLGSSLENGTEALRFRVCDIVGGQRTRIGLNHNVYQITLSNGAIYKICFNLGKNIAHLEQLLARR